MPSNTSPKVAKIGPHRAQRKRALTAEVERFIASGIESYKAAAFAADEKAKAQLGPTTEEGLVIANSARIVAERAIRRQRVYGLTNAQYSDMLASQGGMCAMACGSPPTAVDHDHATGLVRGLLCNKCNLDLGIYEKVAHAAAAYLRRGK